MNRRTVIVIASMLAACRGEPVGASWVGDAGTDVADLAEVANAPDAPDVVETSPRVDAPYDGESAGPAVSGTPAASCGAISADPCFVELKQAFADGMLCFGHPDACASSGGTAECGVATTDPTHGLCSFRDGAKLVSANTSSSATLEVDDRTGAPCWSAESKGFADGTSIIVFTFRGGKVFRGVSGKRADGGVDRNVGLVCPSGKTVVFPVGDVTLCNAQPSICCSTDGKCGP